MATKSFEKNMERLETIVSKMESGDLTLDDALAYYEEGIKLSRVCYARLAEAEKKIEKLVVRKSEDGPDTLQTEEMDLFNEPNP